MQQVTISVDCSCYMNDVESINLLLKRKIIPLLKYHFNIISILTNGVFIEIHIDIENSYMDYCNICNYCRDLIQIILFDNGFDLIISVFT